mmetsp:Transcript_49014/g.116408  ORF Transcript_49014/g.116408 Transcript_49014/m.116408 type:complete len:304 (-) Transcript_49014:45-956(-)
MEGRPRISGHMWRCGAWLRRPSTSHSDTSAWPVLLPPWPVCPLSLTVTLILSSAPSLGASYSSSLRAAWMSRSVPSKTILLSSSPSPSTNPMRPLASPSPLYRGKPRLAATPGCSRVMGSPRTKAMRAFAGIDSSPRSAWSVTCNVLLSASGSVTSRPPTRTAAPCCSSRWYSAMVCTRTRTTPICASPASSPPTPYHPSTARPGGGRGRIAVPRSKGSSPARSGSADRGTWYKATCNGASVLRIGKSESVSFHTGASEPKIAEERFIALSARTSTSVLLLSSPKGYPGVGAAPRTTLRCTGS